MSPRLRVLLVAGLILMAGCAGSDDTAVRLAEAEQRIAELEQQLAEAASTSAIASTTTTTARTTTTGALTTTTAPTTTTTSRPAPAGTRESPIPLGEWASIGEWSVRVVSVNPDGTQAVFDENSFNEPPTEGYVFFLARLEATYTGNETGQPMALSSKAVGPSNVAYEGMNAYCGVIPDDIDYAGEVFPGGTISGNVCWQVAESDLSGLVLIVEDAFSFDGIRVFYRLTRG